MALVTLRKCARRMHWISGGRGYDGMGARESALLRDKLDEAGFWLGALIRSLNAGGERAKSLGYGVAGLSEPGVAIARNELGRVPAGASGSESSVASVEAETGEVDQAWAMKEAARIMAAVAEALPGTMLETSARSWLHLFDGAVVSEEPEEQ